MQEVRDFWDKRPCNFYHSNKSVGSKEYFDEIEKKKYTAEPHLPLFADHQRWKDKKVLELGCGLGTDTTNFARAGAIVTAVDLSPVSAQLCRQRLEVMGVDGTVLVGNIEELNTILPPDEQYDLIYSWGVIHHTPNPKKVIESLLPFLKEDGELRIMLYSLVSYKAFHIQHYHNDKWDMSTLRSATRENAEAQTGCPVAYLYTFDDIRELLQPLRIKDMWKDHIFTWDVDHYVKGEFVKHPAWKNVSDEELHRFEKELGWHTMVVATK